MYEFEYNNNKLPKLGIQIIPNLGNSYVNKLENINTYDILYSHLYICDVLQVLFEKGYVH